jgi:hypothetical protein
MIDVRLTGGLGNQLFQFAAAVVLSRRFELPISLWAGAMQSYATPRDLALPLLIDLSSFGVSVRDRPNWVQRTRMARLVPGVRGGAAWVSDRNLLEVARSTSGVLSAQLDGYFIESIDQDFFDEALTLLQPAIVAAGAVGRPKERICAMHIRGGDFVKLGWTLDDRLSYYQTSLARVLECDPDLRIAVVTDDRDHAAQTLHSLGVKADIRSGDLRSDFDLLRTASYAILSNSTFSFWAGAWRSPGAGGWSTFAPALWRPGAPRSIRLRSEWGCS